MTDTTGCLEQWQRGWRVFCPDCTWHSGALAFPNPDAALHGLTLHKVLCRGRHRANGPADG